MRSTVRSLKGLLISLLDYLRYQLVQDIKREFWSSTADKVGYGVCLLVLLIVFAVIEYTAVEGITCC